MSTTMEAKLSAAGAIVATDPGTEKVVPYVACSYSHPALAGRTVVRVLPQGLQEAEDLALSTMGLEADSSATVGFSRRIALGFPAWPLIHDPSNARHALALVKDLERAARMAKAKPGAAKDDIDALAVRLGSSAPHFLPTFLEEVGRIFVGLGNRPMAGQFFGRARTAERVHSLAIDENRHREVFLEFAFAGALTVKALTEEAKDLPSRVSAEEAYKLFRHLSVERVEGGLPPYAAMAKDLRSMAKAAKLDAVAEDISVVAELLTAPSTKRAVKGFWTTYAKAIAAAAKDDAGLKLALLTLFPSEVDSATWVKILRAAGAVDLAKEGAVELSTWLGQLMDHHHGSGWGYPAASPELEALIAEIGALILAQAPSQEGARVIALTAWRNLDLDLLDVLAELNLEVSYGDRDRVPIDVSDHLKRANNSRSLEHLAASAQWKPILERDVVHAMGRSTRPNPHTKRGVTTDELMAQLDAYPGLRTALRSHLSGAMARAESSLYEFGRLMDLAESLASPTAMTMVGDLLADLPAPDIAAQVAAVFNTGIMDELGWESLETTVAEYESWAKDRSVSVTSAWPNAVVFDDVRATVVGREGIVIEHTAVIPKGYEPGKYSSINFTSVADDLLVDWSPENHSGDYAYWASNPQDIFKVDGDWVPSWIRSLPVGETGRTFGHRQLQVGERAKLKYRTDPLAGDGKHFWLAKNYHRHEKKKSVWLELDVATGEVGRESFPAFISTIAARRGVTVQPESSTLRPLPTEYADNPLGWANGAVGHCWYVNESGDSCIERLDGVQAGGFVELSRRRDERYAFSDSHLMAWPGGSLVLAMRSRLANAGTGAIVSASDGTNRFHYSAGTTHLVEPEHRHNLRPRHTPTSERLRTVTGADLAVLVSATQTAPARDGKRAEFTAAEQASVNKLFPGIPYPLMAGIMGILHGAKADAAIAGHLRGTAIGSLGGSGQGTAEEARSATTELSRAQILFQRVPAGFTSLTGSSYRGNYYFSDDSQDVSLTGMFANMSATAAVLDNAATAGGLQTTTDAKPVAFFKKLLGRKSPEPTAPGATAAAEWVNTDGSWVEVFQSPAAMIAQGMAAHTSADDKDRYALILQAVAESGLANSSGELGGVRVRAEASRNLQPGQLLESGAGKVLLVAKVPQSYPIDESKNLFAAVVHGAPSYEKLGLDLLFSVPAEASTLSAADLQTAAGLLGSAPAATDRAAANGAQVQALVEATGMLEEEAIFLLAGIPVPEHSWHNLESDFVKTLGLTASSAKLARDTFDVLDRYEKRTLLASLVPNRASDYFTAGVDAGKVATCWTALFGPKIEVEPEILRAAFAGLKGVSHSMALIRWALSPNTDAVLHHGSVLDYLQACLWLAYNLPARHPSRALLPHKIMAIRGSLANWTEPLLVGTDTSNSFRTSHGLPSKPHGAKAHAKENPPVGSDSMGIFTANYDIHNRWEEIAFDQITVNAAKFTAADLPVLATIETQDSSANTLRTLFDGSLDEFCAALSAENFAAPGALANPLVSAPDTVAQAVTSLGVSEEAAALFLQYLALPDPTNPRVQKWNGWTPAKRTKAGAELEKAKLVVRAKRARAGRELFLDGGWVTLTGSNLPVEAWKTALYGLPVGDKPQLPLENLLLSETLPQLFERAWARYESGDKPQYSQLKTGRGA